MIQECGEKSVSIFFKDLSSHLTYNLNNQNTVDKLLKQLKYHLQECETFKNSQSAIDEARVKALGIKDEPIKLSPEEKARLFGQLGRSSDINTEPFNYCKDGKILTLDVVDQSDPRNTKKKTIKINYFFYQKSKYIEDLTYQTAKERGFEVDKSRSIFQTELEYFPDTNCLKISSLDFIPDDMPTELKKAICEKFGLKLWDESEISRSQSFLSDDMTTLTQKSFTRNQSKISTPEMITNNVRQSSSNGQKGLTQQGGYSREMANDLNKINQQIARSSQAYADFKNQVAQSGMKSVFQLKDSTSFNANIHQKANGPQIMGQTNGLSSKGRRLANRDKEII